MRFFLTLFSFCLFCLFPAFSFAATFPVINTLDAGAGSLRAAITQANATAGADVIDFGIAGTITLLSDLPAITEEVFIDGSSAPAWGLTSPVVVVDGNNVVAQIFQIQASAPQTHIRGLVLSNANTRGIYVNANNCMFTACFIGTDITGTIAASNNIGIDIRGDNNRVGTDTPADANLISANGVGITIFFGTSNNSVQGNLIGTDISGNNALGNTTFGVQVYGDDAIVGGSTFGSRNIISANANGVQVLGDNAVVRNNYVGLNAAGTAALGNTGLGILIQGDDVIIGGMGANEGNVVSANDGEGIGVSAFGYSGAQILGNYIGVDPTGTIAFGNGRNGIALNGGAADVVIGGTSPQARNIISNNAYSGITCNTGRNNFIYGNYIGTDVTGTLPMGNQFLGIAFNSAGPNYIGNGTALGANVIGDNVLGGISLNGPDSDSSQIKFNYIGTDPTGLINLANDGAGVYANGGAEDNEIGGPLAGEGNIIAFNTGGGVLVNFSGSTRNLILGNSIYDHPIRGIRLSAGGNNNQPAPVLTGFANGPGTLTLFGTFNSAANTTYRLEFFSSSTTEQGKTYLGTTNITTDALGTYALAEVLPVTITGAEPIISATATDPDDNTSEFGSEIVLGSSLLPLAIYPVEGLAARLTWELADDAETYRFMIEHKQGDKSFAKIGEQTAFTRSQNWRTYQYEVASLAQGMHYFRLRTLKQNGTIEYSNVVQYEQNLSEDWTYQITNPLSSQANIAINTKMTQNLEISLYNLAGQKLHSVFKGTIHTGTRKEIRLDTSEYPAGLYLLKLSGERTQKIEKVIIE